MSIRKLISPAFVAIAYESNPSPLMASFYRACDFFVAARLSIYDPFTGRVAHAHRPQCEAVACCASDPYRKSACVH